MTGFFETTAPTESLPLDMVGIKAIITQQGAKQFLLLSLPSYLSPTM